MADSLTDLGVVLTTLRPSDGPMVRNWLRQHLQVHNRAWVDAHGRGWSRGEVDAQLMASNLVEKHWDAIWRRSRDDQHFVAVTRLDERSLGLVWCAQRQHEYLDVPVGVLQWIFVAPWARGHGVASAMVESGKEWMRVRG